MAFKMKGNINFGEGTGRSAFPSVWEKLKKKAKKTKEKVKEGWESAKIRASSQTGTHSPSPTDTSPGSRYDYHKKKDRARYDAGETLAEPLHIAEFEKEDRGKAVDKYIASVTKGDTKKSGENLKKVAKVVKKQKDYKKGVKKSNKA